MASVTDFVIVGNLHLHRLNDLTFYSLSPPKKLTIHKQGRKNYSLTGIQLKVTKHYMITCSNSADKIYIKNESREYEKLNTFTDY